MLIRKRAAASGPDFRNVDLSRTPAKFVRYLADISERPEVRESVLQRAHWAKIAEGNTLIDIGCGVGSSAGLLAEFVGASGSVLGVDKSRAMVTAAEKRGYGENTSFEVADGENLPYKDESFDVVWMERTLVHMVDVERALNEARRVMKSGGVAVFAELDYAGVIIDDPYSPQLTRTLIDETVASAAHPRIGRELQRRATSVGLRTKDIKYVLHRFTDFQTLFSLLNLEHGCETLMRAGGASKSECSEWKRRLKQLSDDGCFTGLLPVTSMIAEK